jgi:hypothetical protein
MGNAETNNTKWTVANVTMYRTAFIYRVIFSKSTSDLNMKTVRFYEKFVTIRQSTWRNIQHGYVLYVQQMVLPTVVRCVPMRYADDTTNQTIFTYINVLFGRHEQIPMFHSAASGFLFFCFSFFRPSFLSIFLPFRPFTLSAFRVPQKPYDKN